MKNNLSAALQLTRFREFTPFVCITTLLGIATADGAFGLKFFLILAANLLTVAFAFMINDIEDAELDSLDPKKSKRNPVSSGKISHDSACRITLVVAIFSLLIYLFLGFIPFLIGFASLSVNFFYSWKRIRLKTMPGLDLISHSMMLAGFQFLTAFVVFSNLANLSWILPFLFVSSVSLYGQMFNEVRDFEIDSKAGIKHTAYRLGKKRAQWIMMGFLFIGLIAAVATLLIVKPISWWVIITWFVIFLLFDGKNLINLRKDQSVMSLQAPFQKPIEISFAFSLFLQFLIPWFIKINPF